MDFNLLHKRWTQGFLDLQSVLLYPVAKTLWGAIFILLISGYIQVLLGTRAISRYPAPRTPFLEHLNSFNFSSFS